MTLCSEVVIDMYTEVVCTDLALPPDFGLHGKAI